MEGLDLSGAFPFRHGATRLPPVIIHFQMGFSRNQTIQQAIGVAKFQEITNCVRRSRSSWMLRDCFLSQYHPTSARNHLTNGWSQSYHHIFTPFNANLGHPYLVRLRIRMRLCWIEIASPIGWWNLHSFFLEWNRHPFSFRPWGGWSVRSVSRVKYPGRKLGFPMASDLEKWNHFVVNHSCGFGNCEIVCLFFFSSQLYSSYRIDQPQYWH